MYILVISRCLLCWSSKPLISFESPLLQFCFLILLLKFSLTLTGKPIKCNIYWIPYWHVGWWKNFPWIWDVRQLFGFTTWSFYEVILEMTGITCRQVWTTPHLAEIYRISCQKWFLDETYRISQEYRNIMSPKHRATPFLGKRLNI